ncbi:GNAT family N-acetyltransferase [Micromonospora arborensis]|uniref:GNAT family N-acetyltransferase n=1 Tax=Micromonospora arborensis TaxID=2116518 RepID=A0A318NLM0_9ACTN|nr:GNAT family N-acetyltransferase [Micromonospora arborensis]PYC72407.1 GNAT family N-acetyltransferase [Micromonospora arborensis]
MTEVTVRLFRDTDAEPLAVLVARCLREVNSRDYPADLIERMCAHFDAARFRELATVREVFVAEQDGRVVGTVSRDGNKVYTMFVDPDGAGRGVGRRLMHHIERLAGADGHDHMETGASITGHGFYQRLGYQDVRVSETDFGLNYILRKPLP